MHHVIYYSKYPFEVGLLICIFPEEETEVQRGHFPKLTQLISELAFNCRVQAITISIQLSFTGVTGDGKAVFAKEESVEQKG